MFSVKNYSRFRISKYSLYGDWRSAYVLDIMQLMFYEFGLDIIVYTCIQPFSSWA